MKTLLRLPLLLLSGVAVVGCADQPYYGRTVYEGQTAYPQQRTVYERPAPPPPRYERYDDDYRPAYQPTYQDDRGISARYGVVTEVRRTNVREARGLGAGAVIGALVGGVVGSTVGHGTGRTLATVGGAVAGGAVGQGIQNRNADNQEGYLITVRVDNGNILTIAQDTHDWVRAGQRVRIDGYGDNLRVVPQ
jgi:outer membrane lipoprotein SlyB